MGGLIPLALDRVHTPADCIRRALLTSPPKEVLKPAVAIGSRNLSDSALASAHETDAGTRSPTQQSLRPSCTETR